MSPHGVVTTDSLRRGPPGDSAATLHSLAGRPCSILRVSGVTPVDVEVSRARWARVTGCTRREGKVLQTICVWGETSHLDVRQCASLAALRRGYPSMVPRRTLGGRAGGRGGCCTWVRRGMVNGGGGLVTGSWRLHGGIQAGIRDGGASSIFHASGDRSGRHGPFQGWAAASRPTRLALPLLPISHTPSTCPGRLRLCRCGPVRAPLTLRRLLAAPNSYSVRPFRGSLGSGSFIERSL